MKGGTEELEEKWISLNTTGPMRGPRLLVPRGRKPLRRELLGANAVDVTAKGVARLRTAERQAVAVTGELVRGVGREKVRATRPAR